MSAVETLEAGVPLAPLCDALGLSRATLYRHRAPPPPRAPRPTPARALDEAQKQAIVELLSGARFVDRSPAEVVHTLLDEQRYLASERTLYRILAERDAVRERRNQLTHPAHVRPELVATRPSEVWSWDISRLRTTVKWSYLYLYVLLDLFSRYAVGWMIARTETAALAKLLIEHTIAKYDIAPGSLILHNDRGTQMTSKTLAQLLADLDVTRSFSRPYVSNDNPFSESQFKTVKYHPSYPGRFSGLDDALPWGRQFFPWYNHEHRHSSIAYLTPADVFHGRAEAVLDRRHAVLIDAYARHPERFPNGPPKRAQLPPATYINPPRETTAPSPHTPLQNLAHVAQHPEIPVDPAASSSTRELH
jgi:putative transposase